MPTANTENYLYLRKVQNKHLGGLRWMPALLEDKQEIT